jgi:hypothetical protein
MPFSGESWIKGLEAIVFTYQLPVTIGATGSGTSPPYFRLPFVALLTDPPHQDVLPVSVISGEFRKVFFIIPFLNQMRPFSRYIIIRTPFHISAL